MKPGDLQFMFSEMVQRSEQLFFTPVESMDERLYHLPLFLEALASIIKEVDEVCYQMCTCIAVVVLSINYITSLQNTSHTFIYYLWSTFLYMHALLRL